MVNFFIFDSLVKAIQKQSVNKQRDFFFLILDSLFYMVIIFNFKKIYLRIYIAI